MGLGFAGGTKQGFADAISASGADKLLPRLDGALSGLGGGYIVGGFVRDSLLGRASADIDISVPGDAVAVARHVAAALDGRLVVLGTEVRVARVVLDTGSGGTAADGRPWQLDFSSLGGDLERDLARRDFTVNAIAIDLRRLLTGAGDVDSGRLGLLDPYDGTRDLERGLVRSTGETAFRADPARLLRAVRLAAELGFAVEDETRAQIRRHAHRISEVAGERVRGELVRLLNVPGSGRSLAELHRLGLLLQMVPELGPAGGFPQPKEHYWNVLDHSLMTAAAVDYLLREGPWEHAGWALESVPWSAETAAYFRSSAGACSGATLLKLAAVLHDIAKPQTRSVGDDGRVRFLGHARAGACKATSILTRLRFSAREIGAVRTMVQHHLRPVQMSQQGMPSARAIYRFFRDTGEAGTVGAGIGTLYLSLADHLATRGPMLDAEGWREHAAVVSYTLAKRAEERARPRPAKLVDGHDLMDAFGLRPGPRLGALLEAVREARAAGEVASRRDALEMVGSLLEAEGKT